jgi:hypothetical protein
VGCSSAFSAGVEANIHPENIRFGGALGGLSSICTNAVVSGGSSGGTV